jgi:hypothetical protein
VNDAVDKAPLEVKDVAELLGVIEAESVLDQHDMHLINVGRLDSEHAEDFAEQRVVVVSQVTDVLGQNTEDQLQLSLGEGLDDELVVVAEEEETATPACTLTRLEDHVTVELWREALVEETKVGHIHLLVEWLENSDAVESDSHSLVQSEHILFHLVFDFDAELVCLLLKLFDFNPVVLREVVVVLLGPVAVVFDFNFVHSDSCIAFLWIAGQCQPVCLRFGDSTLAIVTSEVGELRDSLEDHVDEFHVEGGSKEEEERCHLTLLLLLLTSTRALLQQLCHCNIILILRLEN